MKKFVEVNYTKLREFLESVQCENCPVGADCDSYPKDLPCTDTMLDWLQDEE